MTENGSPYKVRTRYFCTICGKEFFGTVEGHFYLDHKDIRKRHLPMCHPTQTNIHDGKDLSKIDYME